jgi:hypothetical protein
MWRAASGYPLRSLGEVIMSARPIGFLLWPILLACSASCSSDTTPTVYIQLSYQVRCLDCNPRAPDDNEHVIKNVDGEDGYKLTCQVKKENGVRRVDFSVAHTSSDAASSYTFTLEKGSLDGDDSSGECQVTVIEGDNTYKAPCSSDEPSDDSPCQAQFSVDKGVIKGGVLCNNILNEAASTLTRYVVSPGTRTDPAGFSLYGCAGL